ncbi:MAG: sensor histidine kinase [Caldilinea sp. CFX5]|nr:sensor histidine kinase [Caldilinea sp. CFX5]
MTIRLRLTLLYTSILALALIGFSLVSYATIARNGIDVLTNTLTSKMRRIAAAPDLRLADIDALAFQFAGPEILVQSRTAAGEVADRTANLQERVLPFAMPTAQPQAAVAPWTAIAVVNGERLLIYNQPLVQAGRVLGFMQIAASLTERDRTLAQLRRRLWAGDALIIGSAFAIGWLLAGVGLRPIQRITETAQSIGASRDFSRRVPLMQSQPKEQKQDEVSQLAITFNAMLAELQSAHLQTEEALTVQRRFVADASHELRTPLTTIRGNLGLLQRSPPIPAGEQQSVLHDLVAETERLIRLVNQLFTLARSDAGHTLPCEPVSVKAVVGEVYRQTKLLAPERVITCEAADDTVNNPMDNPMDNPMVMAARDALKQVLLILLDNAIKHTPPPARIALTVKAEASHVLIAVCDEGEGIPADQVPYLFDRFYQVASARNSVGAGLGLAIAKVLTEAQQGVITVTSQPGVGSTFQVLLPRFTFSVTEPAKASARRLSL